ncbi:MAG: HU family DNA-binding protein [Planctomycetota bacterium]
MKKADLIAAVQKQLGVECSKSYAERTLHAVIGAIEQGLRDDGEVQLVGFGTFHVKQRKARTVQHPQTREPLPVAPTRTVGFRPGTALRRTVCSDSAPPKTAPGSAPAARSNSA